MTNLLTILPHFDVAPFSHILPSLEKASVSTADLLTLDALHVAKRAQVPPAEVKKLADALLDALHQSAGFARSESNGALSEGDAVGLRTRLVDKAAPISTLDDSLDAALGGGVPFGHLTEIVGESAAGKTQVLLTLLLSAQLHGKEQPRSALYISTEAPLQTTRLAQILNTNPKFARLPAEDRPSLSRVHSTHIHDVEAQEHILRFQVPVAISKHNIGILIIDSIAANYRAEFDKGGKAKKSSEALAKRSTQLAQTGALLRNLARTHKIAVVVANQVADRFTTMEPTFPGPSQSMQGTKRPASPTQSMAMPPKSSLPQTGPSVLSTDDPLSLDHQQRFFTGWGDDPAITNLKTPSLGLAWTNQLSSRIALLKDPIYEVKAYYPGDERNLIGWKRTFKVVFSAWCAESTTDFEIWEGGIRSAKDDPSNE
ncbi:DNA repair rhp57 [Lecanosticta acicola]|uniref:DNA repair rhp57 n=1 Tax=Lecanosticta acicola TaxID=111012 RepID=A0AAI9ECD5_9PEZI|nr:DNA repair rhp57 [Lecanosticta acicola]